MSFMKGFAAGFVPAYNAANQARRQEEQDISRLAMNKWLTAKEKYDKAVTDDAARVRQAKDIVSEMPNVPEDAWKNVYGWLVQGRNIEKIREDLQTGTFNSRRSSTTTPAASTDTAPARGTTDDQMVDSGLGEGDGNVEVFPINRPGQSGAVTSAVPPPVIEERPLPAVGETAPAPAVATANTTPAAAETPAVTPAAAPDTGKPKSAFARFLEDIKKSPEQRAQDMMIEAAGGEDVMRAVMGGYKPRAVDPTLSFLPATPEGKKVKLTEADVAGQFSALKLAAVRGEPGALEKYNNFVAKELPVLIEALSITSNSQGTTDLVKAYDNLRVAQQSGDQASIAAAQARVDQLLFVEGRKNEAKTSGQQRQFVQIVDGVPTYAQGFSTPTANGRTITDTTGTPLQGTWREVTEAEKKDGDEALKTINSSITKYQQDLTAVSGGLRLAGELVGITREYPVVMTRVAGGVRTVQDLFREANTFTAILRDVMNKNNGQATLQQLEAEAQRRGLLPAGMSLEEAAKTDVKKFTLGDSAEQLSGARALFEAKVYLMAFRAGGLEGQSGNAMSNKDFDRLLQIIMASRDPKVFEQQLADYMRGRVNALGDTEAQLNSTEEGLIGRFKQQYGYSPVPSVVKPLSSFVESRNDPALRTAYDLVMGRGPNPMPGPASPANARPTGPDVNATGQNTQGQQSAPREVPGYTFRGYSPEGKPVYADKDGNLFVAE